MSDENKDLLVFDIPDNAISNSYIFNIHFTNWIEAIVFVALADIIIWNVGFVTRVKWIVIAVVSVALLFVFLRGIKGRTLTLAIYNAIKGFINRKEYHLGGINDDRKAADMAQFAGQSRLERIQTVIKQKGKAIDERYGSEE